MERSPDRVAPVEVYGSNHDPVFVQQSLLYGGGLLAVHCKGDEA